MTDSHRRPPARTLAAGLLVLAAALCGAPASAQTVVGNVVEATSAQPLVGAWVALVDRSGVIVTATLADDEGRFVLAAPRAGSYRVLLRMIGYRDAETEPFDLGDGEVAPRTIQSSVRAVNLDGIRVDAAKRCGVAVGGDADVATLWSEARKAIEILEWAEGSEVFRYHVSEERMVLDASSLQVTAVQSRPRRGIYARGPYESLPADELAAEGYIQRTDDGTEDWEYYAPDGTVLLSDTFLDTHCFRVSPDSDDDRVGLRFEPVEGRVQPDIEGVLWLDRASAELRQLDFRYVRLPFEAGDWPQVGGRVVFERLANGMWFVQRWYVRMPLEAGPSDGSPSGSALRALSEFGARVVRVETAAGETLSQSLGAGLTGVVRDVASGEPLEDAVVDVVPAGYRTLTSDDGSYRLSGLPSGAFRVRVVHSSLDALGAGPVERPVELEEGRTRSVDVEVGLGPAVRAFCRERGVTSDGAVLLYGSVSDSASGVPVSDARVSVETDDGVFEVAEVGEGGEYRLCAWAPALGDAAEVVVHPAGREPLATDGRRVADLAGASAAVRVDLAVDVSAYASAFIDEVTGAVTPDRVMAGGDAGISGRVYDPLREDGVGAAIVRLVTPDGEAVDSTVADAGGRFRVLPSTTGPVFIEVSALGYTGRSTRIDFLGEPLLVEVDVQPTPVSLDGLDVTVERRSIFLDRNGFYRRRRSGTGDFIDFEELDLRGDTPPSRLILREGGASLSRDQPYFVRAQRPDLSGRRSGVCLPIVVIDDQVVRSARDGTVGGGEPVPFDYLLPPANEIAAMEVYSSSAFAPIQWKTIDNDCGVIAVWTRR